MRSSRTLVAPMLLLLAAGTAGPAAAREHRVEDERFHSDRIRISLDFLLADLRTSAEVDSSAGGDGTDLDLEDDLGLETGSEELSVSGHFKMGRRHRILFGYETFERSATKTLERDVQVGDHVFLMGSQAKAGSTLSFGHLDYRYDFVHGRKIEAGVGGGLVFARADFAIEADVDDGTAIVRASDEVSLGFPVPEIGFGFDWFPGEHFVVRGGVSYFQASFGDVSGSWADVGARLEWMPWKHAGFGVGYRLSSIGVDFENEDDGRSGQLDYQASGLTGGFTFTW